MESAFEVRTPETKHMGISVVLADPLSGFYHVVTSVTGPVEYCRRVIRSPCDSYSLVIIGL